MSFANTSISLNTTGDNTILNVTTGDLTRVYALNLTAGGTVTVIVKDEAGTTFGTYFMIAGSSMPIPVLPEGGDLFTAVGDIIINLSGNITVGGNMIYQKVKQA